MRALVPLHLFVPFSSALPRSVVVAASQRTLSAVYEARGQQGFPQEEAQPRFRVGQFRPVATCQKYQTRD